MKRAGQLQARAFRQMRADGDQSESTATAGKRPMSFKKRGLTAAILRAELIGGHLERGRSDGQGHFSSLFNTLLSPYTPSLTRAFFMEALRTSDLIYCLLCAQYCVRCQMC